MIKKPSEGMDALRGRVADRLLRQTKTQERTETKIVRMRPHFKLTAEKSANREGVSLESFIRLAMAERMKWKGDL